MGQMMQLGAPMQSNVCPCFIFNVEKRKLFELLISPHKHEHIENREV